MIRRAFPEDLIEAGILFSVLFLPSYLTQTTHFDPALLFEPRYNLQYIIVAVPQVMLLLFSLYREDRSAEYGLQRPSMTQAASIVLLAVLLCILAIPVMYLRLALETGQVDIGFDSQPEVLAIPALVLTGIAAVSTGYREELYFRSLLYVRLKGHGFRSIRAGAVSSILFAAGHAYQGAIACVGVLLVGGALTIWFERQRNVHVLAFAHGIYNIVMLLIYRTSL